MFIFMLLVSRPDDTLEQRWILNSQPYGNKFDEFAIHSLLENIPSIQIIKTVYEKAVNNHHDISNQNAIRRIIAKTLST